MNSESDKQLLDKASSLVCAGQLDDAEKIANALLAKEPNDPEALNLLGVIAHYKGDDLLSAKLIKQAIQQSPNSAHYYNNLGILMRSNGYLDDAIQCYNKALLLDGDYREAKFNLANALSDENRFSDAEKLYLELLRDSPDDYDVRYNLAQLYQKANKLADAIFQYKKLEDINSNDVRVLNNLGLIYLTDGEIQKARKYFERVIAIDPFFAPARFNYAQLLLLCGDYDRGWAEYEWRWQCNEFRNRKRNFSQPQWDGSLLSGKTLLVYCEQGYGDAIQFVRYIQLVRQYGENILLECAEPLINLFKNAQWAGKIIKSGEKLPPFDVHISLLSLPYVFKTTLKSIPLNIPYLRAGENVLKWTKEVIESKIGKPDEYVKVGIVWAGGKSDLNRNIPPEMLFDLSSISDVKLLSLQTGAIPEHVRAYGEKAGVIFLGELLKDFEVTAGFISHMDLVITIDTATAHLAGALGSNVWTLLPYSPDPRWMLYRCDSPWYPTMKLFRQAAQGDWKQAMTYVRNELFKFAAEIRRFNISKKSVIQVQDKPQSDESSISLASDKEDKIRFIQKAFITGLNLQKAGRHKEAIQFYKSAIKLSPSMVEAHFNLAIAYTECKLWAEAEAEFIKAIKIAPDYPGGYLALGSLYNKLGRFDEAELCCKKEIFINPHNKYAHFNLGVVYQRQNRLRDAIGAYRNALRIDGTFIEAHWQLATCLLANREWSEGWEEYEWRIKRPYHGSNQVKMSKPQWDGCDIVNKTLLLQAEQGFGDTIMALRFAPVLASMGVRVFVQCQDCLERLARKVPGVEQTTTFVNPQFEYDYWFPIMSLFKMFKVLPDNVPGNIPYIFIDNISEHLLIHSPYGFLKVGFVWAGSSVDQERNIPVEKFQKLFELPNIQWICLQKGERQDELNSIRSFDRVIRISDRLNDFFDTAQVIQQLDLVITIDTSVAHLAGAMGKPVWILLPYNADWRWLTEREDSPWYPSAVLFRQAKHGDWDSVVNAVYSRLSILCNTEKEYLQINDSNINPGIYNTSKLNFKSSDNNVRILFNKGVEHFRRGEYEQAEVAFKSVLEIDGENIDAILNLGLVLKIAGRPSEAMEMFKKALAINPSKPGANLAYASVLLSMGMFDAAKHHCEKEIQLQPNNVDAYYNLGLVCQKAGNLDHAVEAYKTAIRLNEKYYDAYLQLGVVCMEKQDLANAITCFHRCIEINPETPDAHWHLANAALLQGNYELGFEEMKWRWRMNDFPRPDWSVPLPAWDGADIKGKTVVILPEQGAGDIIQFSRYACLMAHNEIKTVLGAPNSLKRLLSKLPGINGVITSCHDALKADYYVWLMDLPKIFRTREDSIPSVVPYIFVNSADISSTLLLPKSSRLSVGLVWTGNRQHARNRYRSIGLDLLKPLLNIPDIDFYSLQIGDAADDIRRLGLSRKIIDLSSFIHDFYDTALVISQLDLVISVDTAVAHLAGALGKPVWTLLPYLPDWRWQLTGESTPWYPTMRLFRQTSPNEWAGVISKLTKELPKLKRSEG